MISKLYFGLIDSKAMVAEVRTVALISTKRQKDTLYVERFLPALSGE